ncbi:glutaredoxin family protein [Pseudodesulfovibrio cashew]|uniref:Glutaredoxin family protein n=1 Tax=Pseudodesulfovibrio cashew TaxID=2678688 RepID=A0A6I6JC74_9BACT|nr:glutaredoxin family protein [Pseudodesulfovibrio cashew]QGY40376.1 glutaredoxin family protein [Pseudodesulfovibrio cashew]
MSKKVTLYALSTCPHCHNAMELLTEILGQSGFKLLYTDRLSGDERNIAMRELRAVNPDVSFPTTVVGNKCVIGFKADEIRLLVEGK